MAEKPPHAGGRSAQAERSAEGPALQTGTGSALRTPTAIATALPKGWSGGLQTGTETASMIGRKTNMVAPIVLRV
jgi:hypothetical protein